jgi:leucine dehydrogenase
MELGAALVRLGMTTLEVRHEHASGSFEVWLSRDWDPATPFAAYAGPLWAHQVACEAAVGGPTARALLAEADALAALDEVERRMAAGRHERVQLRVAAPLEMRVATCVHSTRLGRRNGSDLHVAGGIRVHAAGASEQAALLDGLDLARAMSFKNAAAHVPFGGCKLVVQSPALSPGDAQRLGFLAHCIDVSEALTGPDVGFGVELIDALRARFTRNVMCGSTSPLGQTGSPTAQGVWQAIREAAAHLWGSPDLAGRRVAVQGLGAVGRPLALQLRRAGAALVVADPDPDRLRALQADLGTLTVEPPEQILSTECDVLAPCALGGVLDRDAIERLRCRMVYGSANNQLAAHDEDGELELAGRLAARGILFQPDWTYTMGGVLVGWEEYREQQNASAARVAAQIERCCAIGTRELLAAARQSGRTPTAEAYETWRRQVY